MIETLHLLRFRCYLLFCHFQSCIPPNANAQWRADRAELFIYIFFRYSSEIVVFFRAPARATITLPHPAPFCINPFIFIKKTWRISLAWFGCSQLVVTVAVCLHRIAVLSLLAVRCGVVSVSSRDSHEHAGSWHAHCSVLNMNL